MTKNLLVVIFLYSFNPVTCVGVCCMPIIRQSNALETDWQKVEWSKSHWLSRGLCVCRWLVDCLVKGCVCVCEACSDACPKEVWQSEQAVSSEQTDISPPATPRDRQYPQTNRAHVRLWQLLRALLFSIQVNPVPFLHLRILFLVNSASHFMLAKQYCQWKSFMAAGKVILPQFEMASSCGKCLVVILTTGGWLRVYQRHCCFLL